MAQRTVISWYVSVWVNNYLNACYAGFFSKYYFSILHFSLSSLYSSVCWLHTCMSLIKQVCRLSEDIMFCCPTWMLVWLDILKSLEILFHSPLLSLWQVRSLMNLLLIPSDTDIFLAPPCPLRSFYNFYIYTLGIFKTHFTSSVQIWVLFLIFPWLFLL